MTPHERCPFCGCSEQIILPCEVLAEQSSGKYKPETWCAVLCNCCVTARAGRTEKQARANWNKRPKVATYPDTSRLSPSI
jgi:hypothetical protein